MRIKNERETIDYNDTINFFENRAKKYNNNNPYSVTMYQDNNPELVIKRNNQEINVLKPKMQLSSKSKVLDVACGIGRWYDSVKDEIMEYCGLDFCNEFIELARARNNKSSNCDFFVSSCTEISTCLKKYKKSDFDRVLMIGVLMYLNDDDVRLCFEQINEVILNKTVICIREPIGIESRLTLKDQFSEELNDSYNAIYRTRDEIYELICKGFIDKGFSLNEEGFLFKNKELNNRRETAQYYFVLER